MEWWSTGGRAPGLPRFPINPAFHRSCIPAHDGSGLMDEWNGGILEEEDPGLHGFSIIPPIHHSAFL
jgi:hypothetical protein